MNAVSGDTQENFAHGHRRARGKEILTKYGRITATCTKWDGCQRSGTNNGNNKRHNNHNNRMNAKKEEKIISA